MKQLFLKIGVTHKQRVVLTWAFGLPVFNFAVVSVECSPFMNGAMPPNLVDSSSFAGYLGSEKLSNHIIFALYDSVTKVLVKGIYVIDKLIIWQWELTIIFWDTCVWNNEHVLL